MKYSSLISGPRVYDAVCLTADILYFFSLHVWDQKALTGVIIVPSAHRLLRLLAAVCAVGLLGGFAVGVWFLGESLCWEGIAN